MTIEVRLLTGGQAPAGINVGEILEDLRAEVNAFASRIEAGGVKENRNPAPDGAQGYDLFIEWIIDIAKDPVMYGSYIKIFLNTLNGLMSKGQEKKSKDSEESSPELDLEPNTPKCKIKISGKELVIPASVAAIKKFLESIEL